MEYKSVRGMEDMLPQDAWIWHDIEAAARREFESSGYSEIRTPILEDTSVFVRGIGETTDIVTKEMFTFPDRKERSLTMRPEGTAPIVRAYIEHALLREASISRLYYIGPMFRAERPQKGRLRQFFQIGAEVIGSNSPFADIEAIAQINNLMKRFALKGFNIKLNTLGCKADKAKFAQNLKNYLSGKSSQLCDDCRSRMEKNVLRVLDCKNPGCKEIVKDAPNVIESLCDGCRGHFEKVKGNLTALGIKFEETKNLVRGLDYYTGTVFEITHPSLGGQDAIGAGGRYDNLVKDMGGADVGAVGYALGIERMIIALKAEGRSPEPGNIIYIATMGDAAKLEGIKIAQKLRDGVGRENITVLTDIGETSLKSQLRSADKNKAKIVIMIGEDELKQGKATVKDMSGKEPQAMVSMGSIVEEVRKALC
ncbi:MAG: histidine--tRNA ligase [Candidatus Omnitrophica bacterium]|nr:histidine--tRNA ligase [Candidatus Omnitrophota bacterium]